ncbi:CBS domain-containing protein [Frateuria defendens]|uniref:CBS domain-containing protein n=1 Tax=Frateuria defendens TaxID=2219559 RepID=UPI00066FFEA2|nr:CBS domain-containing protein [Frateuria defendens]
MNVREIMTPNPRCCTAGDTLHRAAMLMREEDVGEIPVIDEERHLVGVITDRDIVTRCVATGDQPSQVSVEQCMTAPALSLHDDASVKELANLMAFHRIRRVPITDRNEAICGIVALADLERSDARSLKAEVFESVSIPH